MARAVSVLIPLGLTAAVSAADEGIQKKVFGLFLNLVILEPLVWEPEH